MAKHRGMFKRKGSDIWWYRYADSTGKLIRRSSLCTSFKEAEQQLRVIKTSLGRGIEPEDYRKIGVMTFDELAERYLPFIVGQGAFLNKKHTVKRLRDREVTINKQSFRLGVLPLRAFTSELMEQIQTSLKLKGLKEGTTKGLKDNSINRILNVILNMFTKAEQWRLITETMLKEVHRVKLASETGRLSYLSAKKANELVSACDEKLKPIVICALQTGMRKNEILKLTWEQVDFASGYIRLPKTKNGHPKNVPINATLREVLNKRPRRFVEVEKNGQKIKELVPYVFHNPKTLKPYVHLDYKFKKALAVVGIRNFRFHDLRHSYASLAIMSGKIDVATLSKLLGHTNLKQTMQYAHFDPNYLTKAAHIMDEVYSEASDTELAQSKVNVEATI